MTNNHVTLNQNIYVQLEMVLEDMQLTIPNVEEMDLIQVHNIREIAYEKVAELSNKIRDVEAAYSLEHLMPVLTVYLLAIMQLDLLLEKIRERGEMGERPQEVVIGFISVEKVYEVPWNELSGMNLYETGWWDNTLILYSDKYSTDEMKRWCDEIQERCLVPGNDWEDYSIGGNDSRFKFLLSDCDVVLVWSTPCALDLE